MTVEPANMSKDKYILAETQSCKQGSVVVAYCDSVQCYFRPKTEELVFIADHQAGEFEYHWREMSFRMDQFHQANAHYSSVLETYGLASASAILAPVEADRHSMALLMAESELESKRKALQLKLGEFSQTGMSYDDVVELVPLAGQKVKNQRRGKSKPYVYVKKGYFTSTQDGRKLHTVSLKGKDKASATASIYSKDNNGNVRIDTQKLTQQLSTLQWPKLKLELQDVLKWSGADFDLDELKRDVVLFDWAESWNNSLQGESKALSANVDVSGGAQFMRFASNLGANAEFDLQQGQASIKGEAKASLTLASGTVNLTAYVPDRLGWSLSYTGSQGQVFDMGLLRLYVTPALSGFIGASVLLEEQSQVVVKGDRQLLAGQPGGRLPRFYNRRSRGAVFHQQMAEEDEGLQLSGEAFAGVRAEGSLTGGLQWLKPTPPPGMEGRPEGIVGKAAEFTDFCTISSSVSGLMGAGIGGKFHCTFINGRFCFHVAASLCWGLGAKGGLICEVGVETIVEFGTWLIYQLYRLNYSFFELVAKDAFATYSRYCVMRMDDVRNNLYEGYGKVEDSVDSIRSDFFDFIDIVANKNKTNLESSKRRNQLAKNVISRRQDLLRYTPEAKGILLYLLTRHGIWDHLDLENRGDGLIPDIYKDRKDAVSCVLRSIQTQAEWGKVLCRMTPDGTSLAQGDEPVVINKQEQQLIDFLQEGFNRERDFHKARSRAHDELAAVYDRLKNDIAWGYALAMNDSEHYLFNDLPNLHYPMLCTFGPCNIDSDQLA
jgi:hypothetical protein